MAKRQKSKAAAASQTSSKKDKGEGKEETDTQKDLGQLQDSRRAIYERGRKRRQQDLKRAEEEISRTGESDELIRSANLELAGKDAEGQGAKEAEDETGKEPSKPEKAASDEGGDKPAEPSSEPAKKEDPAGVENELEEVVIYGRRYKVPKRDIERAGGIEAYQRSRAANLRMQEAAALEQRAQRRMQEISQRERELEEREKRLNERPSPQSESEEAGSEPPDKGAQQSEDNRKRKVEAIVDRIYSGKKEEAAAAIEEIMSSVETRPEISSEAVANMVIDRLKQESAQGGQGSDKGSAQTNWEAEAEAQRKSVNAVMESEYSDVLRDGLRLKVARARFDELKNQPLNYGRDPADIAREAGEYARQIQVGSPEDEITRRREEKQDMPPESSARSKAAAEEEPETPSPQSHIQRLRKKAGLE